MFEKLTNLLDTRVKSFLTFLYRHDKQKSLRVQLAQADIIHSQREIKEIFDPEKHTCSIKSEHKST